MNSAILPPGVYLLNNGPKAKGRGGKFVHGTQASIMQSLQGLPGIRFTKKPEEADYVILPEGVREPGEKSRRRNPALADSRVWFPMDQVAPLMASRGYPKPKKSESYNYVISSSDTGSLREIEIPLEIAPSGQAKDYLLERSTKMINGKPQVVAANYFNRLHQEPSYVLPIHPSRPSGSQEPTAENTLVIPETVKEIYLPERVDAQNTTMVKWRSVTKPTDEVGVLINNRIRCIKWKNEQNQWEQAKVEDDGKVVLVASSASAPFMAPTRNIPYPRRSLPSPIPSAPPLESPPRHLPSIPNAPPLTSFPRPIAQNNGTFTSLVDPPPNSSHQEQGDPNPQLRTLFKVSSPVVVVQTIEEVSKKENMLKLASLIEAVLKNPWSRYNFEIVDRDLAQDPLGSTDEYQLGGHGKADKLGEIGDYQVLLLYIRNLAKTMMERDTSETSHVRIRDLRKNLRNSQQFFEAADPVASALQVGPQLNLLQEIVTVELSNIFKNLPALIGNKPRSGFFSGVANVLSESNIGFARDLYVSVATLACEAENMMCEKIDGKFHGGSALKLMNSVFYYVCQLTEKTTQEIHPMSQNFHHVYQDTVENQFNFLNDIVITMINQGLKKPLTLDNNEALCSFLYRVVKFLLQTTDHMEFKEMIDFCRKRKRLWNRFRTFIFGKNRKDDFNELQMVLIESGESEQAIQKLWFCLTVISVFVVMIQLTETLWDVAKSKFNREIESDDQ